MKILLVNNHHSKVGGAETVYFNTIELLLESGVEVVTLSRKNENTINTGAKEYFIEYSRSFLDRIYSSEAKKQIEKIIEIEKPYVAHLHNTVGGITFSVLSSLKKAGIPAVMTIHDFRILCPAGLFLNRKNEICEKCGNGNYLHCISNNCSRNGITSSVGISVETFIRNKMIPLNNYCNHLVFVSNFTKNKFLEHFGNCNIETSVIHNPVFVEQAKMKRGSYFLYVGRLAKEKGVITLLKTFAGIPEAELHIVGDGPLMDECKEIAAANVKLLGYLNGSKLIEQFKNAFFTIIPSECYENLPMSALESFSHSKPVIGSKLGGITELIESGSNGFYFDAKSVEQLKSIITSCLKMDDEQYFSMCENSFTTAKKKDSFTYSEKLISLYKEILHKSNSKNA
ncbi:MAG: glycosyl transferase family protein [Ignavibacteria bacterium]|nr:MAG: glycosyl transferase family protein [Ignavibacteria bacterium]KAF0161235.1 MAG: glycosyl transferase family protein [Ignavibacteria bacterium]